MFALRLSQRQQPLAAVAERHALNSVSRRSLFIGVEETPNPSTLKFKPSGKQILKDDNGMDFRSVVAARRAPLARDVLMQDGVSGVYLGKDFIAVTKKDEERWQNLKPFVYSAIMQFFSDPNAVPVLEDETPSGKQGGVDAAAQEEEEEDDLILMIKELLEEKVRPMAQDDGGDVIFKGFDEKEGVVHVQLLGSCVGCPSSTITLKNGVENMLRHYIPEVTRVDAVMDEIDSDDQTHHLSFKPDQ